MGAGVLPFLSKRSIEELSKMAEIKEILIRSTFS
jgi:hypothetical protein